MSDVEMSVESVSVIGGNRLAKKKIKIKKKIKAKNEGKAIYDIAHDSMKKSLPGVF